MIGPEEPAARGPGPRGGSPRSVRAAAAFVAVLAAGIALACPSAGARPPKDDVPRPPAPDPAFFARTVSPWLDANCAACHRSGAGGFRLATPAANRPDADRRAEDFDAALHYVDREAPWRSRLLLKVLPEERGGLPHAGGALLSPDDDVYDDLLDFASGATLSNLPPEPEPGKDRRVTPGVEVTLDGSLSYDRDEDKLQYRWELFARPPGSKTAISNEREKAVRLTPDVGGTYVVRLRVFDGKVWSAAKPVVLEALDRVGPVAPDAVTASGLEKVSAEDLRLVRSVYGDLLGRPPTPPEAIAGAGKPAKEIGRVLLQTLEAGRAWIEDAAYRLGLVGDLLPASEAVESLPYMIAGGTLSPADVEAVVLKDPAFLRAHPTGISLADAIGRDLLGKDLDAKEREAVLAAASGAPTAAFGRTGLGSASALLDAVLASEAFRTAALRRYVARLLSDGEAAAFPAARSGEGTVSLALSILESSAYAGAGGGRRRADDPAFVRAIFADLLGRRPGSPELHALARAAAVLPGSSAGRAAVVAVLLDSGEVALPLLVDVPDPDAWIADRFLRYLGRTPSPEEGKAYRQALVDPDGGPQVVVRALLTGPEYAAR